jgi:predicted site-specific integrase-resolvase
VSVELIPVTQAAQEFGVSERALYRYLKDGRLRRYRRALDRRTYLDRQQLRRLVQPRVVKAQPSAVARRSSGATVRSGYVRTTDRFRRPTKRLVVSPQRKGESDKDYATRMDAARAEAHERLRRQRR